MVDIRPASLRDVSFIAANMRECDRAEIFCQVAPGTKSADIAAFCIGRGQSWTAFRNGLPSGAFGFSEISDGVLNGWAFGRPGFGRCIPAVTRFVFRELVPGWQRDGVRRIEVRTIESHESAHRWLAAAGAVRCCSLEDWGRGGERFYLYAWTCRKVPEQFFQRWLPTSPISK
ncbi:hypothetical protein [Nitratireductor sp. XY-223]|uniref:hypothetical protein n=1 Tax=Nitratireductor sp. XY-223 TaxID=2561926 RepID=UPI0010AAE7E2|nr:hypothetical protein [Nitratireductor sp. XY-223]